MTIDDKNEIDDFTEFELATYTKNMLISIATGGEQDAKIYEYTRSKFIESSILKPYIPSWLKTCRTVKEYWSFIKENRQHYSDRRTFLSREFSAVLDYFEFGMISPINYSIKFDEAYIHNEWEKALDRKTKDPEGAITISRTLIESVLKFILKEQGIEFNQNADLSEIYKEVAKLLNLAPEQHQEVIFKQILGGSSAIVNGLGQMRNKLGDSHGTNGLSAKPEERHSELAVNLAGTMSIFLYKTYKEKYE